MNVVEQIGLREDPFRPASSVAGFGVAPPIAAAFEKLLAAVRRADPLTVLVGRPGMGKTLILSMLEDACRADGLDVRMVTRGDMAHTALGSGAQLLIVDEADTINTATLTALAPGASGAAAPIMVFAVAQPALHRLSGDVRTTIVDIRPLDADEARAFLLARAASAGRPDLFDHDSLNIIVGAARGSPRLLRVLAGAAMFQAAGDGSARIGAAHASLAATMHGSLLSPAPSEPTLPAAANDTDPRIDEAVGHPLPAVVVAHTRTRARQRVGVLSFAASVALAALVLPVFLTPDPAEQPLGVSTASASQVAARPMHIAASAFAVAPANAAVSARPSTAAFLTAAPQAAMRVPALIAAPAWSDVRPMVTGAGTALPRVAVANLRVELPPIVAAERPLVVTGGADRSALVDLLGATRPRIAIASRRNDSLNAQEAADAVTRSPITPVSGAAPAVESFAAVTNQLAAISFVTPTVTAVPPVMVMNITVPRPQDVEIVPRTTGAPTAAILQVTPAKQAADTARLARTSVSEAAAVKEAADTTQAVKVTAAATKQVTAEAQATREAAQQAKESARQGQAAKEAAEQAKVAADQSKAAKEAAAQAAAAKAAAEQAQAAKLAAEQARAAKDAAEQSKAAKAASDQAKAAREAADQAQAAKEAAGQAKAAKEAAEQAKASKLAAEQAKAAKEAAQQAKAAKDAADQAKAAKEAAEQAKSAKEAAEQAKAAKDAADQAKAAKDAADQAKAAKEAADQAKAAKEAAEQAKAVKEAAEQAKTAKEAAEQAKAAKEAVEQAQAAKEAAEQAKAAKEAADLAKAAKDAADQAQAAKDAADQAKAAKDAADLAKAAKDAADQAKAVKDAARAAKDAKDAAKAAKDAAKRN